MGRRPRENKALFPIVRELVDLVKWSGLYQYQIADRAGVAQPTISDLAKPVGGMKLAHVIWIGEALGYELQWVPKGTRIPLQPKENSHEQPAQPDLSGS